MAVVVVILIVLALVTGANILLALAAILAVIGVAGGVLAGRATAPGNEADLPERDGTALGDTSETHDEINPHDIPKDSPERQTAERMAEERGREDVQRQSSSGPASGG